MKYLRWFVQALFALPYVVFIILAGICGFITDNAFSMYIETGEDRTTRRFRKARLAINFVVDMTSTIGFLAFAAIAYPILWLEGWASQDVEYDEFLRSREG